MALFTVSKLSPVASLNDLGHLVINSACIRENASSLAASSGPPLSTGVAQSIENALFLLPYYVTDNKPLKNNVNNTMYNNNLVFRSHFVLLGPRAPNVSD